MYKSLALTLVMCALALFRPCLAMAQGAEPIGSVQEARGAALAVNLEHQVLRHRHFRAATVLAPEDPIFEGDTLVTGPDGELQVFFADGTVVSMGPESCLVLDQLAYEPQAPEDGTLLFTLGPGLFRTVTGEIARDDPESFQLRTPLGMIGIRGTEIASLVRVTGLVLEGGRPYAEVMREQVPFLAGQPLGLTEHVTAFLEELRQAIEGSFYEELHVHVAGSLERHLEVSDLFGRMASLPRAQGARLLQDGLIAAGPCDVTELAVFDFSGQEPVCSEQEIRLLNTVRIDRRLPVPRLFQSRYGNNMGGGSDGNATPDMPGSGGGNTGGATTRGGGQSPASGPTNRH